MPLVLLLIAAALLYKFAGLIALVLAVVVGAILIGKWLARRDDRAKARRRRDAEICARADRQNAQVLAGDQQGIYGEYPPAVSPRRA